MYFSRTLKALNFDFQIQGLSRAFKVRANPEDMGDSKTLPLGKQFPCLDPKNLPYSLLSSKQFLVKYVKRNFSYLLVFRACR